MWILVICNYTAPRTDTLSFYSFSSVYQRYLVFYIFLIKSGSKIFTICTNEDHLIYQKCLYNYLSKIIYQ